MRRNFGEDRTSSSKHTVVNRQTHRHTHIDRQTRSSQYSAIGDGVTIGRVLCYAWRCGLIIFATLAEQVGLRDMRPFAERTVAMFVSQWARLDPEINLFCQTTTQ